MAGVHRAQAHDGGVDRVDVAADDGLRGGDDVARDEHRVDRRVRMRAVAALAVDRDLDAVGGGHRRSRRDADAPRRQARPVVQRIHLLGGKALEQPVGDHRLGPGIALLAGLEDEVGRAVEAPGLVQVLGRRQQHRRVAVMAAAVHAPFVARLVRERVLLLHRQRIHVGAQAHRAPAAGARAVDHRDDPGLADPDVMLDAQRRQPFLHDARGSMLLEAQFRMRMQVAADGGEFVVPTMYVFSRFHSNPKVGPPRGPFPSEVFSARGRRARCAAADRRCNTSGRR